MNGFPRNEAVIAGGSLSAATCLIGMACLYRRSRPYWEGVVINKYLKIQQRHPDKTDSETIYTTIIVADTGKKKLSTKKIIRACSAIT